MRKKRKYYDGKRNLIVISSLVLIFLVCFFVYRGRVLSFTTFFQDIGSSITSLFVSKRVDYLNTTSLQEENLKEENEDLKKLLELKNTMSSYEMIYTTITNRNTDYWFYTVTIDKGKKDGISEDMVVINESGLVGRVIEVHPLSSVVKLITSNDSVNKIAVDITSGENTYKGIISGYDSSNDYILVTSIRSTSDIKEGDIVTTNGLGTLFPEGIMVGEVKEISNDDLGVSKVLKVKSFVDFENIRYLAVLKRGD